MRVIAVAGASGGHIYPALSFLAALESRHKDVETLFVVPRRGMGHWIISRSRPVRFVATVPLALSPLRRAPAAAFGFLKGCAQALEIMIRFRPQIVVGFGTLDSIPLIVWAWLLRTPTLLHEQNVRMGKANAFLSHIADTVAVSFPQTLEALTTRTARRIVTGNPLRPGLQRVDRAQALRFFGLEEGRTTILAVGGSQGSGKLNAVVAQALVSRPERDRLQVIHITGRATQEAIAGNYQRAGIKAKVLGYLNQMEFAYSVCDAAVSRAGATTVAELGYFKIPAVLIPYPYAQGHQRANAEILRAAGAAEVIEDAELTPETLGAVLARVTAPPEHERMRQAYDSLPSPGDSAQKLVEAALAMLKS